VRLGFFGGSFDPVHAGHLLLAESCREALGLARVTFVVAGAPPHKLSRSLAPAADRIEMVRLAVAGHPAFAVDARETVRAGPSYTIETLRELRLENPADELFWLIGADTLPELPTWREAREILEIATVATAFRPGHDPDAALSALAARFPPAAVERLRSHVVPMPLVGVSSTDLRERARGGRSLRYLTPDAVIAHIGRARLYA
jgi:nicotinate-nucleotide adenylyltransferase